MAVNKPVAVPERKIDTIDITKVDGGFTTLDAQIAPPNSFIASKDVELDSQGFAGPRRNLTPLLPPTVEDGYQIYPVDYLGVLYFFTCDDGKVKFCQRNDTVWTDCASPAVHATLTTALTGANNDLTYTAVGPGTAGNAITIAYVNAGATKPLVVTVTGNAISVQLATNGSSVITSTGSTVLAAILASTAASALVGAALAISNTGAGLVTVLAATNLTGGSGTNFITTQNGGMPIFLRVLDKVLCINGGNGDKLFEVDLATPGFPIVKYLPVVDPTTALTDSLTNLSSGSQNIYYAYSYDSGNGETLLAPITTIPIDLVRDQWQTNVATPSSITLTRPSGIPTNALAWNLYMAVSSTGGVIQTSDMLQLATNIDLATTTFTDDGSLGLNLGSVAPIANSSDGPRVTQGIVEDGNPILYGDVDVPSNVWIGGGGQNALNFSISGGGFKAQPEQGTNFVPTVVIGFRNGVGTPSLTVLYSNTEGLSKQAVLEQQNVTYGDTTFSVWGVTEQHYGAAGVAATNSAVNYDGQLIFLSTDGFMSMNTQPLRQNVISTQNISTKSIDSYVRSIKNSAMRTVIGAAWNGKFMWLSPAGGFDTPQQILVLDTNLPGLPPAVGAWETFDIPAQWIGVVSPDDDAAFVYIVQGNQAYVLSEGSSTFDTINGVTVPFSTSATGPLIPMRGEALNQWQAVVQVMFYILQFIGEITIGVTYRNQNGDLKTKSRVITGPEYTPSPAGGWGDVGWGYSFGPSLSGEPVIDTSAGAVTAVDIRKAVTVDDIASEAQWFYSTPTGYNHYKIRARSFEGIDLGVRPDLQ